MNSVSTMSTRQLVPARCTSKAVSMSPAATMATALFLRLAMKAAMKLAIRMRAMAEGSRDVKGVTSPVGSDSVAMHHWKNGGL